jgi:hypothetical protein
MIRTMLPLATTVLLLAPGSAGAAPSPVGAPAAPGALHWVAESDFSATKDRYVGQASDSLAEWRRKLDEFGDRASAQAHASKEAAERDLDTAWRRTQGAADQLGAASQDGWERAKGVYEKASRELKEAWDRNTR